MPPKMSQLQQSLQSLLDKSVDGRKIFGTAFAVRQGDFYWQGAAGDLSPERPFFIASTTKLFTTARILQLRAEGRLALEDKLIDYADPNLIEGLHRWQGRDLTPNISIAQLLGHRSGLPDYFQDRRPGGKSLEKALMAGNDQSWSLTEAIDSARAIPARFPPGADGRAHYADTNFQLLGHVIERVSGQSYAEGCRQHIFAPLQLSQTYLYSDPADQRPQHLYYRQRPLHIPQAMVSFGPDGGAVSTAAELLSFLQAFFDGRLFPAQYLASLQQWARIFFPMQTGIGIHRFSLPWIFNPFGSVPAFIGHSGLSGALAYYCPDRQLFVAGTVNQVAHPDLSFRLMIQLAQLLRKAG